MRTTTLVLTAALAASIGALGACNKTGNGAAKSAFLQG